MVSRVAGYVSMLLSVGALAVALVAHGGRWSPMLDVAGHFALICLAVALLALVLAPFAPPGRRRLPAGLSLTAATAAVILVAPEFRSTPASPVQHGGVRTFKVVQFNAWGKNARPAEAAAWILAQAPDAVVMEESGHVPRMLVRQGYAPSCRRCGVLVLTRVRPISTVPERDRQSAHVFLAAATIPDAGGDITIVGVHRGWPTSLERNRRASEDLRHFMEGRDPRRIILAGDFNSTPWSFQRRQEDLGLPVTRRTRAMFSWPAEQVSHNRFPAPFPYLPIDHVYAGSGWVTVKVERGPRLGSDHYPIVVTLAAAPVRLARDMTKNSHSEASYVAPR